MTGDDQRLVRHLSLVVAIKLAILALLYWLFVHGAVIGGGPDPASVPQGTSTTTEGVAS